MEANEVTQTALARLVGVKQPTVWEWLNGRSKPRAEMLRSLSEATGMSIDDLLMDDAA